MDVIKVAGILVLFLPDGRWQTSRFLCLYVVHSIVTFSSIVLSRCPFATQFGAPLTTCVICGIFQHIERMATKIKSLIHNQKEYHRKMQVMFKTMTHDEKNRIKNIIQGGILSEICPKLQVLSVGSGNGKSEGILLNSLSERYPRVFYTAVEPAEEELQQFKTLSVSKKAQKQWENIDFKFHNETIDDYIEKADKGEVVGKFHVIVAVHCVYHFSDPVTTIQRLYDMLEDGGMLLNLTLCGDVGKLQMEVGKHYYDPKNWFIDAEWLEEKMRERLPDAKITTVIEPQGCKINACFDEESSEGNDLLDFITQILNFRKTIPKAIQDEIMESLNKKKRIDPNGDIFINWDTGFMVIQKK